MKTNPKFNSEKEAITYIRNITPPTIRPAKNSKRIVIEPFVSNHAFKAVTESIGKQLYLLEENHYEMKTNRSQLTDEQSYEIAKKFYSYCLLTQDDKPFLASKAIPLIFNECLKFKLPNDEEIKQSVPYPNPISTSQVFKNMGFIKGARWLINKLNKR